MEHHTKRKVLTIISLVVLAGFIFLAWFLLGNREDNSKIDPEKVTKITRSFPAQKLYSDINKETADFLIAEINGENWEDVDFEKIKDEEYFSEISFYYDDSSDTEKYVLYSFPNNDKSLLGQDYEYSVVIMKTNKKGENKFWVLPSKTYFKVRNILLSSQQGLTMYDNLLEMMKAKTPYIGDNSKVLGIVGNIPLVEDKVRQQYISIKSKEKPRILNVYYELKKDAEPITVDEWNLLGEKNKSSLNANGFLVFSMIENLDEIVFAYRNSPSEGKLEKDEYIQCIELYRTDFENSLGDLREISKDIDMVYDIYEKIKSGKIIIEKDEEIILDEEAK